MTLLLAAVLLAAPAHAQNSNIQAFLNNPSLRPFVSKVIGIKECLSDPSLNSFDINSCPSLLRMLDALALGNLNPAVSCELSCVQQFAKLSDACQGELIDAFGGDSTNVGRLGTQFFEECDAVVQGQQALVAAAPSPAPAAAPLPAPSNTRVAPTPSPAVISVPAPVPVQPTSSASGMLPQALLMVLSAVAAAFMMA